MALERRSGALGLWTRKRRGGGGCSDTWILVGGSAFGTSENRERKIRFAN